MKHAIQNLTLILTLTLSKHPLALPTQVHIKEGHIFGLQSLKTCQWVGLTFYGALRVSGNYFGRSEECYLSLDPQKHEGLALLSAGWGSGGWLTTAESLRGMDDEAVSALTTLSSGLIGAGTLSDIINLPFAPQFSIHSFHFAPSQIGPIACTCKLEKQPRSLYLRLPRPSYFSC
jgi:hypothetical protein